MDSFYNGFKFIESTKNYDVYHKLIANGTHLVRLWVGDLSSCYPKKKGLALKDYYNVEVEIYEKDRNGYIVHEENTFSTLDIMHMVFCWDAPSKGHTRGTLQTIDKIKEAISLIEANNYFDSIVQEAKCRVCDRMNDIGIHECWWCGCIDPV